MTGHVTDWDGGLGAQFSVGDALSLDYLFDTASVDKFPNDGSLGEYEFLSLEGKLGSYVFRSGKTYCQTYPSSFPFGDQFFVYGTDFAMGANVAGAKLAVGLVILRDHDDTFLTGDLLPTFAPDLTIMEVSKFTLGFDTMDGQRISVRTTLETSSIEEVGNNAVPEPTSLLVVCGLCASTTSLVRRRSTN